MNRQSIVLMPLCLSYFLIILLVLQSTRSVQSIALSSLCGDFGHSCFGGNWGKRELLRDRLVPDVVHTNTDTNGDGIEIPSTSNKNPMHNFLKKLRSQFLFQQRLRQLLQLE
ncbi:unnamed protein product [Rotaria socialis]|uniref:Uncharacterized protein n=1 Tax=Rotaria socialis TaxID=392032 RepID=A0A817NA08_9BILA|nr:unnamed protein product [Rotaria socialis]CAF3246321.1 unnamed protein product [Rotaria socialis]CAF3444481.1 unnamed protein product [Rotaria socialis]CAF3584184.1 unnamed protein product [Rotaria socialis]CAF3615905.1 unnamed protein product [Rotaria socialis]